MLWRFTRSALQLGLVVSSVEKIKQEVNATTKEGSMTGTMVFLVIRT